MLKIIESFLWAIATIMILYSGIYFTIKLKFVQFRFKDMFNNLKYKSRNSISLIDSLLMVLGGRIGVGSIAGTSLAITLGGVGSIFWLVLTGIISSANTFAEVVLGVKYKEKDGDLCKGGPCYYIKKGLNNKKLSAIYAFIMLISYIVGSLSIQSNTITTSLKNQFDIPVFLIAIIISFISFFIILGGIKKISKFSSILVPIMILVYTLISLLIILININIIPSILVNIIKEAFNFKAFGFGILGTMIIGVQRGIFSNESGLGTGAIAASTVDIDLPARQGFVQILGTYITTIFICLSTSLIILTSTSSVINVNGIELAQAAFNNHLGMFGQTILMIIIILFAFSTILSGYYDGESNYKNLYNKNINILKIFSCVVLFFGAIVNASYIWQFINIFTALLAIINIYSILKLKKDVINEYNRYKKN